MYYFNILEFDPVDLMLLVFPVNSMFKYLSHDKVEELLILLT